MEAAAADRLLGGRFDADAGEVRAVALAARDALFGSVDPSCSVSQIAAAFTSTFM
jgi:hypothetical protein